MGLSISVGRLAWCLEEGDEQDVEYTRRDIQEINRVLVANGLPRHTEPESLPAMKDRSLGWAGFPYSWLHYLRRAVAFARKAPDEFTPVKRGEDPAAHPLIERELSVRMDCHLICHADGAGFYVPVDFRDPLYDDTGKESIEMLGSCQRVMRELIQVAPLLGITLAKGKLSDLKAKRIAEEEQKAQPLWIERRAWLRLFERFRLSLEHGAVVTFG
jgi:hypothetical protein